MGLWDPLDMTTLFHLLTYYKGREGEGQRRREWNGERGLERPSGAETQDLFCNKFWLRLRCTTLKCFRLYWTVIPRVHQFEEGHFLRQLDAPRSRRSSSCSGSVLKDCYLWAEDGRRKTYCLTCVIWQQLSYRKHNGYRCIHCSTI